VSWVQTDSEATLVGGTSGFFDGSGFIVNFGPGDVSTTQAEGTGARAAAGFVVPTWAWVALAVGALLWATRKR
jgi:hypothetical protein